MIKKISVITVCFNAETDIKRTIKSVLEQSYESIQYIIIDGASTDNTINIISDYAYSIDTFISEEDSGIYDAMNKGAKAASGDYLFFLNAGDTFINKDTLSKIASHDLNGEFIYGDIELLSSDNITSVKRMPAILTTKFLINKTIPHQSVLTKKSLFDLIGGYDPKLKIVADYKFQLIAILELRAKTQYIPEVFAQFNLFGISSLQPFKRIKEKKKVQIDLFGRHFFHESIVSKFKSKIKQYLKFKRH